MTVHQRGQVWPWWSDQAYVHVAPLLRNGGAFTIDSHRVIERLEADFAARHGVSHAMYCGSGTAALTAAYFAVGLGHGAEILAPTTTFRATVTPLLALGYRPVLCDADATGNVDLADAASRLSPDTEAIVVTHLNGQPVDLDGARAFADTHHLALIEDASHAHGARWKTQSVGSAGDVAAFSCGTTKTVTGGMGGMLVTSDRLVYERALLYAQPKHRALREITNPTLHLLADIGLGSNLRGTPVTAVLALDHLDRLDETIRTKDRNLRHLTALLSGLQHIVKPPTRTTGFSYGTWYRYVCRVHGDTADRDHLLNVLDTAGVGVHVPPRPLHHAAIWDDPALLPTQHHAHRPIDRGSFQTADQLAAQLIEISTRELYAPDPPLLDDWAVAIQQAAGALAP